MPRWMKFMISYMAGMAGLWGALSFAATRASEGVSYLTMYGLPMLAAVTAFALVFLLLTRNPLGMPFWFIAFALTALVAVLTVALVVNGIVSPLDAGLIALAVHFGASFFLMRKLW